MIKNIQMTNFRQHEDLEVKMTNGLNVLRGPNEAGKSTILEAVLYALYGAKALRDTLAETVTWGKKEGELKVVLTIYVGGIDYTFKRSKSGAECQWVNHEGYLVTGQDAVTKQAIDLLGADAKTAASLMLADQSGLRGALDDGPTAVSGLMSKLADFDLIDKIIEAMNHDLLLGSEAPTREKLVAAEKELAEAQANEPDMHLATKLALEAGELATKIKDEEKVHDSLIQPYNLAHETYSKAREQMATRDQYLREIKVVETKHADTEAKLAEAKAKAAVVVDTSKIEKLKAELSDVTSRDAARAAYAKFEALPPYPADYWEGDYEGFDLELSNQKNAERRMSDGITAAKNKIALLKKDLVLGGVCPSCGQVFQGFTKLEDIAAKNAAIEAEISALEKQTSNLTLEVVKNTISAMELIKSLSGLRLSKTSQIGDFIVYDHSFYPPKVTWKGEPPADTELDVTCHKAEISRIEAEARAVAQAEGAVSVLTAALLELVDEFNTLKDKIASIPVIDLQPLEEAHDKALFAMSDHTNLINGLKEKHNEKKLESQKALAVQQNHERIVETSKKRVKEYNDDLVKLAFNNNLLKKMRGLKPSITDHLWNTVLSAVSNFFSQLRGENSVVSKDANGFKVNGHSIDSLSGSTLDVLALAVRVALTKTFIPHTDTMILDEPAHGCDDTRTASMLGFLASVGFGQILVASHDELSEAVADNIITLGE